MRVHFKTRLLSLDYARCLRGGYGRRGRDV